jgi:protein arginine kinase
MTDSRIPFERIAAQPSPWLGGEGPHADLVVSTRVRLARNLAGVPFSHRAREEQLQGVLASVGSAVEGAPSFEQGVMLRMNELTPLDRQLLVERHLVSHELADGARPRGILISPEERLSLMVNEEDHLRLQTMTSGFQLADAWGAADRADDELSQALDFAFSEEIGFLTACPTNTGTGMRASVLIHLPALVLLKEIDRVLKSVMQVGLNVRGLYGEHSDVMGNLFQVSNQTTLGHSERESIESLDRVARQVMEHESRARDGARCARADRDKVWRAYGLLRHCRAIAAQEVINLVRRFGSASRWACRDRRRCVVNELLVLTQPAHLQHASVVSCHRENGMATGPSSFGSAWRWPSGRWGRARKPPKGKPCTASSQNVFARYDLSGPRGSGAAAARLHRHRALCCWASSARVRESRPPCSTTSAWISIASGRKSRTW